MNQQRCGDLCGNLEEFEENNKKMQEMHEKTTLELEE